MNINSVLVVCVGNVCRSPLGERLLRQRLPGLEISSAGLGALVGKGADATASKVASARGVSLDGHVARQFDEDLAAGADLILALEPGHRRDIVARSPHLAGRVLLFDQWTGGTGIADPYRRSQDFHEAVFDKMDKAASAWAKRLTNAR